MDSSRTLTISGNMNVELPVKIFKSCGPFKQTPHSHEYMQMWFVKSGSCTHYLNGHAYDYARFGLFIIPPYAQHYIVSDNTSELICCEFSERFINEALMNENRNSLFDFAYLEPFFLSEKLISDAYRISAESAPQIERLLLELLDEFEHQRKFSYLFIKANLLKLLAIIATEYNQQIPDEQNKLLLQYHDAMDKTLSYLDSHFSEKVYLEDVCRLAMMSHSTFSYVFKQVTGLTFSEYIMNLRLNKACRLLRESNDSVISICEQCGFNDSNYFARAFKKKFDISPTAYRKRAYSDDNANSSENN